jgi:hypothetical protein
MVFYLISNHINDRYKETELFLGGCESMTNECPEPNSQALQLKEPILRNIFLLPIQIKKGRENEKIFTSLNREPLTEIYENRLW